MLGRSLRIKGWARRLHGIGRRRSDVCWLWCEAGAVVGFGESGNFPVYCRNSQLNSYPPCSCWWGSTISPERLSFFGQSTLCQFAYLWGSILIQCFHRTHTEGACLTSESWMRVSDWARQSSNLLLSVSNEMEVATVLTKIQIILNYVFNTFQIQFSTFKRLSIWKGKALWSDRVCFEIVCVADEGSHKLLTHTTSHASLSLVNTDIYFNDLQECVTHS